MVLGRPAATQRMTVSVYRGSFVEDRESVMIDSDGDELLFLDVDDSVVIGTEASGFYLIGPNDNNIPELRQRLQRIELAWLEAHPHD
jgi:hypothetical protein